MKRKTLDERLQVDHVTNAISKHLRSRYQQIRVLRERIETIINNEHAFFITFTIDPEHYDTNRDYLQRKLKEALAEASRWVANEDWGDRNGRYHFHAVACFGDRYDYSTPNHPLKRVWLFGNIDFQPIYATNYEAIANYVAKFSNHCTKEKTGQIFYSRMKRGIAHASGL